MKSTIIFLAALSLFGQSVMAIDYYNSFINCMNSASVPTTEKLIEGVGSGTDCASTCYSSGYNYAYYTTSSNIAGTTQGAALCSCSNTQPSASWFTTTVSADQVTTCTTSTDFQAYRLHIATRFDICSTGGGDSAPYTTSTQATYEGCLSFCINYDTIYLQARQTANNFYCICETGATPSSKACGTDSGNHYTIYRRDAAAIASQVVKRHNRERLNSPSRKEDAFCPAGYTACNVANAPGSFECLDTKTELESCGGCVYGEFGNGAMNSTSFGQDCSSIEGANPEAVTCDQGTCKAFACAAGYSLVDGLCHS